MSRRTRHARAVAEAKRALRPTISELAELSATALTEADKDVPDGVLAVDALGEPTHEHKAQDIVEGIFEPNRLGLGTADGTTVLWGDGTWDVPPGGGGGGPHAASHQNGGTDEISVAGLSGLLADGQTPLAHKTSHENGGSDELSVAGLSGVLADPQPPIIGATGTTAVAGNDARLTDARTPTSHVLATNLALGGQHTISGATAGHFLRASSATAANFGAIEDADLPSSIARDSEVTSAVATHAALASPHSGHEVTSAKNAASGYQGLDASSRLTVANGTASIGSVAAADVALQADSAILTGASQYGIATKSQFTSAATTSGTALFARVRTAAAAFTMADGYGIVIQDATKGAGSSITNLYGLYVYNQSAGGTANYAIYTNTGAVSFGDNVTVRGTSTVTATRFIGPATGLYETSGPTALTVGPIADGQYAMRSGSTLIGGTPTATLSLTTVEKSLATAPSARRSGSFQITGLSGLTPNKTVLIRQATGPYTGKGTRTDESEMDAIEVTAQVLNSTTIQAYWNSRTRVRGNYKFDYLISA